MVGQEISDILLDRKDTKRQRGAGDLKNLVRSLEGINARTGHKVLSSSSSHRKRL